MNELLQALLDKASTPLTTLPSRAGQATAEALNNKGWGKTGALAEGVGNTLSDLTSPVSLALMGLGPMAGKAASGMLGAKVAGPVGAEVGSALKPSLTGLGKLAVPSLTRGAKVAETLGEMSPDFTPVGGEGMYNVSRISADPLRSASSLEKLLIGR